MTPREIAQATLKAGAENPYDAPDDFYDAEDTAPPAKDWAHAAARGVMHDLGDRRGIKRHTENVAEDVRAELVQSLAEIIRAASDQEIETKQRKIAEYEARIVEMCDHFRWLSEQVRALFPGTSVAAESATLEQAVKAMESKP